MGIVVVGAVFVDIKGYPDTKFIPGGRNVGRVLQVHGGVCRNVAEDIANIELKPTFVSVVDHTGISDDVLSKLKRHKIDTTYVRRTENGLGTWLAVFDNGGDVVASVSKRPDLSEIGRIFEEHGDEIVRDADSIVVEIDMEASILKTIFQLAEKYQKKVYAIVSNMSIAVERRDLLKKTDCVVCNLEESGILFSEDYSEKMPEEMAEILTRKLLLSQIPKMIVTMGERGAVWADGEGNHGICPPQKVTVVDTTGCGDAFFAGVAVGLTYGKDLAESCTIGTRLASSVIATKENVCPRFLPEEFSLALDGGLSR
ncbi:MULTISPECIES: PfkB family carbohydrate kinase [Agathobacter]|uniref:Carbohydrate kinase family protein n=1 Tax=Agathobacter ruminis TaxID=1712665 RepID=A0A2G3E2Q3_9FIRM|nr:MULTISPECIES: PfkB family carbohydrate kinase [Agathobacter]MBQ1681704.1 carbohydrate kinase family protein [Agathobacter sp.]MDC7300883.1 carbohydrate kinase family protein [Agathobacter ruminis]PHU37430.1 carbohydrate kinase family protein [Agathobacter ruminis]